jgi:hypothetical protein
MRLENRLRLSWALRRVGSGFESGRSSCDLALMSSRGISSKSCSLRLTDCRWSFVRDSRLYDIDGRVGCSMLYPGSHDRRDFRFSLGGSSGGVECLLVGMVMFRPRLSNDAVLLDQSGDLESVGSVIMSVCSGMLTVVREW